MPVKQIQDKKSVRNFYNRNAARLSWLLAVMLAVIGLALILPPALAELTPGTVAVDDKINVSFSGLRLNRSTNTFDSLATLTNKSNEPINIPVQLAITTISASTVTLANATGIQTNGVPYVNVPVSDGILDPGESVSNIQLKFNNPQKTAFTFKHSVFGLLPKANHSPLANAGSDQSVPVGTEVTLNGINSTDEDGDSLTYRWRIVSQPSTNPTLLDNTTAIAPKLVIKSKGSYQIELIVNDGQVDSQPDLVVITTENSKPIAAAGDDQTVFVKSTAQLDGANSKDTDGDTITYKWQLMAKPADSKTALQNDTTQAPSLTPDKPGDYTVELIVNDGILNSDPDRVIISTQNSRPVADAGLNQQGTVGKPVILDGQLSTDVDDDPLSYVWSLLNKPANSNPVLQNSDQVKGTLIPDLPGDYISQLIVNDGHANSDPATALVTVSVAPPVNNPPQITSSPVLSATVDQHYSYDVDATDSDNDTLTYSLSTFPAVMAINSQTGLISWTPAAGQTGSQSVNVNVIDGKGGSDSQSFTITVNGANQVTVPDLLNKSRASAETAIQQAKLNVGTLSFEQNALANGNVISQNPAANSSTAIGTAVNLTISLGPDQGLPPDPATVAPNLDNTVATNTYAATRFLYTGSNPVQTGVAPGVIEAKRAAVIRGKILDRQDNPLSGVAVTVNNHPELGKTSTRTDGQFDLVVNGGGVITLNFQKSGYLPSQRQQNVPWQNYALMEDVVLIQQDSKVTLLDLTQTTAPFQAAQGSQVTDADGSRTATILIPQGIQASVIRADGSIQPINTLTLSFTEYTQGENGPKAMPGPLPPTSGYTYAVEITSAEAIAKVDGKDVLFDRPVPFYVDNFLNMPIGIQVPVGYWDPKKAAWLPSADGRVIKIQAINDGVADLDSNGDDQADGADQLLALGISEDERRQLAGLYPIGKSLWRVPMNHLSTYDLNYGSTISPPDAKPPEQDIPEDTDDTVTKPTCSSGSIIECENQTLGETLPITGTSFTLNYRSDRVPGRFNTKLVIPVTGNTLPTGLQRVELIIEVGGKKQAEISFVPLVRLGDSLGRDLGPSCTTNCLSPNKSYLFDWSDRTDAYGQPLQGAQIAKVRIGYVYRAFYNLPPSVAASFGSNSGIPLPGNIETREPVTLWQEEEVQIGGWNVPSLALGGWSLDVHHAYDPVAQTLYRGDGRQQKAEGQFASSIKTVAGGLNATGLMPQGSQTSPARSTRLNPFTLEAAPDGSLYFIDGSYQNSVWKLQPDGLIRLVAGDGLAIGAGGVGAYSGDGGPATQAKLNSPQDLAVGPDGSLYIADSINYRIRKISPDGIISTIAGNGENGNSPDCSGLWDIQTGQFVTNNPSALSVCIPAMDKIAVGNDGSVYFTVGGLNIFKVAPGGGTSLLAGRLSYYSASDYQGFEDGIPATEAWFSNTVTDMSLGPDGSLFLIDGCRIRQIGSSGLITTVAGQQCMIDPDTHQNLTDGVGGPAAQAHLDSLLNLDAGNDGSLYFTEATTFRVMHITPDGILHHLAGRDYREDGVSILPPTEGERPAASTVIYPYALAIAPDGGIYISNFLGNRLIDRIGVSYPGFQASDLVIPSEDGKEIYRFDPNGRHLSTVHSLTGATLYSFDYDAAGRLIKVTDGDGLVSTVERDAVGDPKGIVAPFGQRTALSLDANGYLASMTNPANESHQMQYTATGLLTRFQDAEDHTSTLAYDANGYLTNDIDAAGGNQTLERTLYGDYDWLVKRSTGLGRTTQYSVGSGAFVSTRNTTTPEGMQQTTQDVSTFSLSRTVSNGDSEMLSETFDFTGPDPRFGMLAPLTTEHTQTFGGVGAGKVTSLVNGVTGLVNGITYTPPSGGYKQTFARKATLTQPDNPLSMQTLTDTVTTQDGRVWSSAYAAATQTFTETSAAGRKTTRNIDALGRPLLTQITGLLSVSNSYDAQGRLIGVSQGANADKRALSFAYGNDGYLASVTDPLGHAVSYEYDAAGRVTTQTLPDGRQIHYTYDKNGNLASLQPPGREAHVFKYTPVGLTDSYVPPDVGAGANQTVYEYDLDKALTKITRPDGGVLSFVYDNAGRLGKVALPTGDITYGFGLTSNRLFSITDTDGGELNFAYQGSLLNKMTWTGPVAGNVAWSFDTAELRMSEIRVNGENPIILQYDKDSLLTKAGALSLSRNAQNGLLTGSALGEVTDSQTYNGFGELTGYTAKFATTALLNEQYSYDKLGRIIEKKETVSNGAVNTFVYSYDVAGRLIEVRKNGIVTSSYGYDDNGNRISRNGINLASYDEQDRLLEYSGKTYSYTANGELSSKTEGTAITRYQYDALGNLKHVEFPNGDTIDYLADGQNRRIGKKINGVLTQSFLWQDQLKPVAELDGSNNVVSRFVYATRVNVPDYMIKGGEAYRIITDHLGSPRLVVKVSDGSIAQSMNYDEFGNVIQDTNPGFQPFGFAGGLLVRSKVKTTAFRRSDLSMIF